MSNSRTTVARQTNIAMLLTALRLILSPVFVFVFLSDSFSGALVCLAIAVISELTDLFDGIVARRRNEVTNFGKILDPLADSISRLTIFICFVYGGQAPVYLVVFILYRDSMVATIRTVCAYRGVVVSARRSGKLKAIVQATAILIILFLRVLAYKFPEAQGPFQHIAHGIIWVVTIVTVLSAIDYLTGNWAILRQQLKSSAA